MVHVAVGEEDMIYRYDLVGGLSYVEADVELGHSDNRFFAGDGVADDVEVVNFNSCQSVTGHNKAAKYLQNVDVRSIMGACQRLFEVLRAWKEGGLRRLGKGRKKGRFFLCFALICIYNIAVL